MEDTGSRISRPRWQAASAALLMSEYYGLRSGFVKGGFDECAKTSRTLFEDISL